MLASVRNLAALDRSARSGQWRGEGTARLPTVKGLTGRRIGILGLGTIGVKIAARMAPFEVEIGYCNRRPRADVPYRHFATPMALAGWADALFVALRADASNRHIVDAPLLHALGPDGHLVNISRGSAVDEAALITALREGTIKGAGLDVYEGEPQIPEDLRALNNVVLSPHMSASTHEAYSAMQDAVLANLEAFFATGRAVTPVPETPLPV
jgi:lactate dehydrogenase-like 2-hydroxyacid dehydrogenase